LLFILLLHLPLLLLDFTH
jgi:hypothetical protein